MNMNVASNSNAFRSVTPEEIAHLQEFGWIKLKKFIPIESVNAMLAIAKEKMGEHGDRNAPPAAFAYFNPLTMHGLDHAVLGPVIRQCGRNGALLMARKAPVGVRYFTDYYNVKLPSKNKGAHGGNGITGWHQDYAAAGSDRSGALIFWIALEDLAPEKGTMAFLNGSHRFGALGHFSTYGKGNVLDAYPELLEHCTPTELQSYAAGDVTVHSNMVVHSAGLNLTDGPRWTYTVMVSPADACWNGGAVDAFDTTGLVQYKPFDDGRFPIIG
ncbi:MAG TPA: phytanoyl-CoA dioxygenase family protein [Spongiibacteraceae bacterium]|nr:phytanoyl-CoA dioxygenase family protein [Spongiibacteraceae bacterium]